MKVNVIISPEVHEAYVDIHTDRMTDEIGRVVDMLSAESIPITARAGEEIALLKPEDIYMIRVENGDTVIYGEKKSFYSPKRLYELLNQLGNKFMQISKSTIINLSYMDSIEPGFSGTLLLKLKNGSKDYVSRKYLPKFKKYLGL